MLAIVELFVLLLLVGLAFRVVFALVQTIVRLVRWLLSALLVIAAILCSALVVGTVSTQIDGADPGGLGLLAAVVTLPVVLWLMRSHAVAEPPVAPTLPASAPRSQPRPIPEPAASPPLDEPAGCADVTAAWARALRLAPDHADELIGARQACAHALHAAAGDTLDTAAIEMATRVRKHLPELVTNAAMLCAEASPAERAEIVGDLLASIRQLAQAPRDHRAQVRARLRDRWATLRAHIAQTSRDGAPI